MTAVLLSSAAVDATTAVEARFFDEQARAAFARGDYSHALEHFLLSATDPPSASVLYNIAICAQLAGRPRLAFVYFERYRDAKDDNADRRRVAEVRSKALRETLALIEITSQPPGATIIIDRRELGYFGETPRVVPLDPGQHTIELELPAYRTKSIVATAKTGAVARVTVALEPRLGELKVVADPPDATLMLQAEGKDFRRLKSGEVASLPVGSYEVRAFRRGYVPSNTRVLVQENSRRTTRFSLRPIPPERGTILVDTQRVVARVYLDGRFVGLSPTKLTKVAAGKHVLLVKAKGYAAWRSTVNLEGRKTQYVKVTLEKSR